MYEREKENLKEEIVKMINEIEDEAYLRYLYALVRTFLK